MNATDAMMDPIDTTDPAEDADIPGSVPPPPPVPPSPPTDDLPPQPLPPPSPFQRPMGHPWWKRPVSRIPNGKNGGKVGGVVSGLAQAYGFDVRTSRIAVLVAPFVLPIVPLLYIALWILLPKTPAEAVPLDALVRNRQRMPLIVVIGIVLLASGIGFGPWFAFGGFPWGLALVGIGVLLWVSPDLIGSPARTDPSAPPMAPGLGGVPPWATTGSQAWSPSAGRQAGQPASAQASSTPASSPRRRRRPVGWLGVGLAASFVAVAEGLDAVDAWNPAVLTVVCTAIAVLIGGLVLGAAVNRSLLGVPMVFVLGAALTFLAVARPQLDGGFGERSMVLSGSSTPARTEQLGAGRLTIDLSSQTAPEFTLNATVGLGQLEVIVPANATVYLDSNVRLGEVEVDGKKILEGVHVGDRREISPTLVASAAGTSATGTTATGPTTTGPTTPAATVVIDLTLRVGAGQISVVHSG